MALAQTACSPLNFEKVFLKLLADMDGEIHRLQEGDIKEKMIRYQTIMACGGYFGPRAKDLLRLSWADIVGKKEKDLFEFKTEKTRKVYFNRSLIKIVERNFKMVTPINIHHLIIHKQDNPMEPISTAQFNSAFRKYLKKFKVETQNPSSHTLRKTFAMEAFRLNGANDYALIIVSKMLNHESTQFTRDYLGITHKLIQETYLKFK